MPANKNKTFVGFGFGPIQSGLFLLEAFRSGNFARLVVAEVDDALVQAVRDGGNTFTVNIAHSDRIEQVTVEGVELLNPRDPSGREQLLAALADADEIATALPSVDFYDRGGDASVAALIAQGLRTATRERPVIAYAAENNNHAAEHLTAAVLRYLDDSNLCGLQAVNTVIGKMSGVVDDPAVIAEKDLAPLTPAGSRAVLVEAFNRILISRIRPPAEPAITAFLQKDDLLPFEEAKLYGHNAIHALIGFLAQRRGLTTMSEAAGEPWIMSVARGAFLDESCPAMLHRHATLDDPLFTPAGYQAYARDLLQRIACPFLDDRVARVTRDAERKLAYDDRFFGTMRRALDAGADPVNVALGAAAAVLTVTNDPSPQAIETCLSEIWGDGTDGHRQTLVNLTTTAVAQLPATG